MDSGRLIFRNRSECCEKLLMTTKTMTFHELVRDLKHWFVWNDYKVNLTMVLGKARNELAKAVKYEVG